MRDTNFVNALRLKCGGGKKMERDVIGAMRTAFEQSADRIVAAEEYALILKKEIEKLRAQLPRWIPVTERLPEERVLVNVLWVNRAPEPYYEKIKGIPFSDTACFYRERWYWDSPAVIDLLAEYGKDEFDLVDDAVEITHWMPLPEPPKEER